MRIVSVFLSFRCCMFMSSVHPVPVVNAVFCKTFVLRLWLNVVFETFTSIFNSNTFHNLVLMFTMKFIEPLLTHNKCYP